MNDWRWICVGLMPPITAEVSHLALSDSWTDRGDEESKSCLTGREVDDCRRLRLSEKLKFKILSR